MPRYNLPQGFNITGEDPQNPGKGFTIDSRFLLTSSADLYSFSATQVVEGLTAYVSESQEYFILTDHTLYTQSNPSSLNAWTKIDINISGSGFGLQETLENGDSASIGFSSSVANVEEVSFIGSSAIPIKLSKHTTVDYLVLSGSGLVIQETLTTPSAVAGALIYSGSNFHAGIG